jgi:hypothetical protein
MRQLITFAIVALMVTTGSAQLQKYNYFHNDGNFDFIVTPDSVTVYISSIPTPLENNCPGLTIVYAFNIYQYTGAENWTTNHVTNQLSVTIPRVGNKVSASVKYFAYGCGWGYPCGFTPWHGIGAKKWN